MNYISRTIYAHFNARAGLVTQPQHVRELARAAALALGNTPGACLTITCPEVKENDDLYAGLVLLANAGAIKEDLTPGGVPLFYWDDKK